MSEKGGDYVGKSKRKKLKKQTTNAHHLLFSRKNWTKPQALYLRRIFVYQVPITEHNLLHKEVLHDVPIPKDLGSLYKKATEDFFTLKFSTLKEGLLWLYNNSSDKLFKESIARQYEFFFQERPP